MLLIMTVPTGESLALSGQESEMLDILLHKGQSYTMTGHSTSIQFLDVPLDIHCMYHLFLITISITRF